MMNAGLKTYVDHLVKVALPQGISAPRPGSIPTMRRTIAPAVGPSGPPGIAPPPGANMGQAAAQSAAPSAFRQQMHARLQARHPEPPAQSLGAAAAQDPAVQKSIGRNQRKVQQRGDADFKRQFPDVMQGASAYASGDVKGFQRALGGQAAQAATQPRPQRAAPPAGPPAAPPGGPPATPPSVGTNAAAAAAPGGKKRGLVSRYGVPLGLGAGAALYAGGSMMDHEDQKYDNLVYPPMQGTF